MFRKEKFIQTESRYVLASCLERGVEIDSKESHDNFLRCQKFSKTDYGDGCQDSTFIKTQTLNFVSKVNSGGETGARAGQTL